MLSSFLSLLLICASMQIDTYFGHPSLQLGSHRMCLESEWRVHCQLRQGQEGVHLVLAPRQRRQGISSSVPVTTVVSTQPRRRAAQHGSSNSSSQCRVFGSSSSCLHDNTADDHCSSRACNLLQDLQKNLSAKWDTGQSTN